MSDSRLRSGDEKKSGNAASSITIISTSCETLPATSSIRPAIIAQTMTPRDHTSTIHEYGYRTVKGSVCLAEHLNGSGPFLQVAFDRAAICESTLKCPSVFQNSCLPNGTCIQVLVLQSAIYSEVVSTR
jgi:hypothetical protein